jgi:hypothetical protein
MFRPISLKRPFVTFAPAILAGLCGVLQPQAAAVEVRIPRQPGIPPAAEEVLAGFEKHAQAILERSTAQMTAKRAQAVQRLQALLNARMQAADLDGALAIRQMIRSLESSGAGAVTFTRIHVWNPQTGAALPQGTSPYPAMPSPTTATPPVLSLPTLTATLTAEAPPAIAADPGDLTAYRSQIGRNLYFSVRGDQGGSGGVWGTGLYTHDSSLAHAAVHAGVLQPGEQGIVLVTMHKGPTWFQGSTRNGVTAGDWDNTEGHYSAYMVQRAPPYASHAAPTSTPVFAYGYPTATYGYPTTLATPALPDTGTMTPHYQSVGQSFLIDVTGNNDGMVWGTDCYTYDSDLSTAAVHAGVVGLGVRRLVRVTVEKGPAHFVGSSRNGVVSHDWNNSGGHYTAYRIEALPSPTYGAAPAPYGRPAVIEGTYTYGTVLSKNPAVAAGWINVGPALEPLPPVPLPDPGNLLAFRGLNGRQFYFRVTGRAGVDHTVWGTDVYTDDSYLATAAVHAGALQVGQAGILRVTILPGLASYQGSQRNGVRSEDYPAYDGSYRIERYQAEPVDDASIRLKATGLTLTGANTLVIGNAPGTTSPATSPASTPGPYVIEAAGPASFRANIGITDSVAPPATPTATIRGGDTIAIGGNTDPGAAGTVRDTHMGTIDIDFSAAGVREVPGDTDMQSVNPGPGRVYYLKIKGRTDGQLWGSDVYTSDSSVGTAAVHAGVLQPGETGVVKVTIAPGRSAYESSTRNGVTSSNYRSWDVSYRVERTTGKVVPSGP